MILAAKKFLIFVKLAWKAHLVAGGTKLGGFVQRLQKSLFVKFRFRFDQLLIDELQHAIGAVSERIMDRLFNGVIGITARGVDVDDRMASGAGDSSLGGRM